MIHRSIIIWVLIVLALPCSGLATQKEFIENYTYNAGEADSKLTCRTVSLLEIKRLLLEKIGTYLKTRTEIKDFQIQKDDSFEQLREMQARMQQLQTDLLKINQDASANEGLLNA